MLASLPRSAAQGRGYSVATLYAAHLPLAISTRAKHTLYATAHKSAFSYHHHTMGVMAQPQSGEQVPFSSSSSAAMAEQVQDGLQGGNTGSQDVRGRTTRRRSSVAETYVCVVAWLVRLPGQEGQASAAASNGHQGNGSSSSSGLVAPQADAPQLLANVQDVRRRFDAAYRRWEPHVTLIPPFIVPFRKRGATQRKTSGSQDSDNVRRDSAGSLVGDNTNGEHTGSPSSSADSDQEDRLGDLQDTSREIQELDPMQDLKDISRRIETICAQHDLQGGSQAPSGSTSTITFDRIDQFPLRRYKTVHLRPSTAAEGTRSFVALQGKLAEALPEAHENSRNEATRELALRKGTASAINRQPYTAHLTLGQASNPQKEAELCEALQSLGLPVQSGTPARLPNGSSPISTPLTVPLEAIQLLYKPIKRSGPYDIYHEYRLN